MIDPRFGARCAIRDTRAAGAERYDWTVSLIGDSKPVARGRAGDIGAARSQAESALNACSADKRGRLMERNETNC